MSSSVDVRPKKTETGPEDGVTQPEPQVGQTLQRHTSSGVMTPRSLFLTDPVTSNRRHCVLLNNGVWMPMIGLGICKLPCEGNRREKVRKYLRSSLKKLQVPFVDLYLVHFPVYERAFKKNRHRLHAAGAAADEPHHLQSQQPQMDHLGRPKGSDSPESPGTEDESAAHLAGAADVTDILETWRRIQDRCHKRCNCKSSQVFDFELSQEDVETLSGLDKNLRLFTYNVHGPQYAYVHSKPQYAYVHSNPQYANVHSQPQYAYVHSNPQYAYVHSKPQYAYVHSKPEYAYVHSKPEYAYVHSRPQYAYVHSKPQYAYVHSNPQYANVRSQPQYAYVHSNPQYAYVHSKPQYAYVHSKPQYAYVHSKPEYAYVHSNPQYAYVHSKHQYAYVHSKPQYAYVHSKPNTPMCTLIPNTPMCTLIPNTPMCTLNSNTPMCTLNPNTPMCTLNPNTPI
ncbi:hypothetical protein V5799_028139 [Amblyomma americanum]|uniref:Uncharacterized protein n=1 Tax=Amblyomma americanum TaxID=6943 RepID=A0AAQ4DDQ3_AMBAM